MAERPEPSCCQGVLVCCILWAICIGCFALSVEVSKQPDGVEPFIISKPFGAGVGPTYIIPVELLGWSGNENMNFTYKSDDVVKLTTTIYTQYVNFQRLTQQVTREDLTYYKRYYANNECEGGCPESQSTCSKGICHCKAKQIFGQCVEEQYLDSQHHHILQYRKPSCTPYCLPGDCYEHVEINFKNITRVKESMSGLSKCQEGPSANDPFDPAEQSCNKDDTSSCLSKDLNMICSSDSGKCQCRKDMKWNSRTAECELYIDLVCPEEIGTASEDITMLLTGRKTISSNLKLDKTEVETAFCALLDSQGMQLVKDNQIVPANWILGFLTTGGLILFIFACLILVMAFFGTLGTCRFFIRSLNPMNSMDRNTQLAALGTIAANEMVERRQEKDDERRAALMQGQQA